MLHYALLDYDIASEVYIYAWHLDIRVQYRKSGIDSIKGGHL
jgi:hypothetical protein